MNSRKIILGLIVLWLLSPVVLNAQEIRYWGKNPSGEKGGIEMSKGRYYEVGEGDSLGGWGKVKEVGEHHLILEQVLTDEDKERLESQGKMVYDVLEIHIVREDIRLPRRSD